MTDALPLPTTTGGDRDASGRFAAGHAKLGGRKRGTFDLRQVVDDDLGPDRMRADLIAAYKAVAASAAGGDMHAARVLFDRACGTVAAQLQLDARVEHDAGQMTTAESARRIASIFATAVGGDPPAAAYIVATVLRGVGDPRLDELATALVEKLNAMPVAANARRNGGTKGETP